MASSSSSSYDNMKSTAYEPFRSVRATGEMEPPGAGEGPSLQDKQTLLPTQPEVFRQHNRRVASNNARFRTARLILRVVCFVFSASIAALQIYQVYYYQWSRDRTYVNWQTNVRTTVWPDTDIRPTLAVLVTSLLSTVVNFLALASLCCFNYRRSRVYPWFLYLSSVPVVALWIASLTYFKLIESQSPRHNRWDIWAWSCKHKSNNMASLPWKAMCIENSYTFAAGLVVLIFQFQNVVLFAVSWHSLSKGYCRVVKV